MGMTHLHVLALIAVVHSKDRSTLKPIEFHDCEQAIESAITNGHESLKAMLASPECGFQDWDGKQPLWGFVIAAFQRECQLKKAACDAKSSVNKIELALKVLKNHRENGSVSKEVVKQAEEILRKSVE